MTEVVPSSALSEVSLRLLCHDDIDTVKHLCGDWFPIEYPDSWYRDITSNKKFFSLAATYRGAIVGMIVAEIKNRTKIHKEDGDILASSFSVDTQVAYILSLGVVKEFRKHGIGSLLLESLKDHISTTAQDHCKAIYLHVLTTNNTAINFYENRDFRQHHYLPYYYSIRGVLKDGFTYVLYINGGHPPWTILDYIQHLGSALANLSPCSIPHRIYRQAHSLICSFLPWSSISTKGGLEYSRTMSWWPCRPISLPQLQARCYAGSGAEFVLVVNRKEQALLPPGVLVLPPCPGTTQWPGRRVYIHWERARQASLPPAPSFSSFPQDGLNFAENTWTFLTLKTQEP